MTKVPTAKIHPNPFTAFAATFPMYQFIEPPSRKCAERTAPHNRRKIHFVRVVP